MKNNNQKQVLLRIQMLSWQAGSLIFPNLKHPTSRTLPDSLLWHRHNEDSKNKNIYATTIFCMIKDYGKQDKTRIQNDYKETFGNNPKMLDL